jgi:nucleotide-binding universal stress UspA family protein
MNPSKTILVPIDFSDCAMDVVRQASSQASNKGASVVLLHVLTMPEGMGPDTPVEPEGASAPVSAWEHLRREAERLIPPYLEEAARAGVQADVRFETGDPARAIVKVAEELGPMRIVMGTHARKGLSRLVLGSVADAVRRRATCPVEAIPTVIKAHCEARSCAWCATHDSPALVQLRAEQSG